MPWKAMSVMDEKMQFVAECIRGDEPMTVLCARYGISRETGYVWKRRYEREGAAGLCERSRAPLVHGRATSCELAGRIIEARRKKPHWGPKKLLAVLSASDPDIAWPSSGTVGDILRRAGLSERRRWQRRSLPLDRPFGAVLAANDTWCIDFKGWFCTRDGSRCDPLTVTDAFSRYILDLQIIAPLTEAVGERMERLMREHGLPRAIRSDNGSPFASGTGAGGLSRLSVRWAKMGIGLERIEPGKPQQNGRHERMHRTLKKEACRKPEATPAAQQERFDAFRLEFNEERPHEALGQKTPSLFYTVSPRPYPERIEDPGYAPDEEVRRVRSNGEIKWRGSLIFLSAALVGEVVGIREQPDGQWLARFADVPVGLIDHKGNVRRYGAGRPPRSVTTSAT